MRALLVLFVFVAGCERAREPPPPPPPKPPPVESIDIMLAIDLSKSMEETDLPRDRLDATQVALRKFVATSTHDRFGIVIYAQQAKRLVALTADRAAIDQALGKIQIGDVPAIGDGLGLHLCRASRALGCEIDRDQLLAADRPVSRGTFGSRGSRCSS